MKTYISIYDKVTSKSSTKKAEIYDFLNDIHDGKWQDEVLAVRAAKTEKEKSKFKKKAPAVTISGLFNERKDSKLLAHSGLIAIDLDNLGKDVEKYRKLLSNDRYCFSIFISISGSGLCMIVKIDGAKHRDAFESMCSYLLDNYGLLVDHSGVNESRLRFVSWDPYIVINDKAVVFKKYLKKEKKRKLPPAIYVQDDFDEMISQMVSRGVDCTEDYRDWLRVGFALADKFGELGRDYFHQLSSISSKYEYKPTEDKYSNILKSKSSGKSATIATIYWFASQAGIPIHSRQTTSIIRSSNSQKKAGSSNKNDIIKNLELSGHDKEISSPIVEQVMKMNIPQQADDLISDVVD